MSEPRLVVGHQVARGKHTFLLPPPQHRHPLCSPKDTNVCAARTYLATLAGMHAVVETGGLVPANAAQHRCAIEFCKEKMPI